PCTAAPSTAASVSIRATRAGRDCLACNSLIQPMKYQWISERPPKTSALTTNIHSRPLNNNKNKMLKSREHVGKRQDA
ncbi:MAG: hypothetical protein R3268_13370, partial [Acidiferrobacterales bacterium]|nr:hypothetical protein [Acidiferrobacterales bacterium]